MSEHMGRLEALGDDCREKKATAQLGRLCKNLICKQLWTQNPRGGRHGWVWMLAGYDIKACGRWGCVGSKAQRKRSIKVVVLFGANAHQS